MPLCLPISDVFCGIVLSLRAFSPFHRQPRKRCKSCSPELYCHSGLSFLFTANLVKSSKPCFPELYCHSGLSFLFTASLAKAANTVAQNCIVTRGFLSFSPPISEKLQFMSRGIVLSFGAFSPFHRQFANLPPCQLANMPPC